jgi:hypothetical protein
VAAETGAAERAGILFGAAERIRHEIGSPLPESEARIYEQYWQLGREQLGDDAYEAAVAAGRAIGVEEATAYAQTEVETEATH